MHEHSFACKSCLSQSITYPLVLTTVNLSEHTNPLYCPTCGHHKTSRPFDYADALCVHSAGLSRQLAIHTINLCNERRAQGQPSKQCDPYTLLLELGANNLPTLTSFAPLHVSCNGCGGTYTLLRNVPDVNRTTPLYCVWCASPAVTTSQTSTEDTAWLSLATHYELPVPIIKFFYKHWSTHNTHSNFQTFMHSELVTTLLAGMNAEPTPESQPVAVR